MLEEFENLVKNYKTCFLIAPTFPIDFKYPNIISMLKKIGADKITELTFGAKIVNEEYVKYIENNPEQKYYITSPCPTIVTMIKSQYPDLIKYLIPVVSPFIAQAKTIKKLYPEHKIIFISPCRVKASIETKEYPDLIDYTITFKELKSFFNDNKIYENDFDNINENFDSLILTKTKIYPISGGLANSSNIHNHFNENEVYVNDGIINIKNTLDTIQNNETTFKFFDLLACDGGCIGGNELNNDSLSIQEKEKTILDYKSQMETKDLISEHHIEKHKKEIENVDFSRIFN